MSKDFFYKIYSENQFILFILFDKVKRKNLQTNNCELMNEKQTIKINFARI